MKKYLLVLLLVIFIIPSIAFASWWNPFSWFENWTFHKTEITQPAIPTGSQSLQDLNNPYLHPNAEPADTPSTTTTEPTNNSTDEVQKLQKEINDLKNQKSNSQKTENIVAPTPAPTPAPVPAPVLAPVVAPTLAPALTETGYQVCSEQFSNETWDGTMANGKYNCVCQSGYGWNSTSGSCQSNQQAQAQITPLLQQIADIKHKALGEAIGEMTSGSSVVGNGNATRILNNANTQITQLNSEIYNIESNAGIPISAPTPLFNSLPYPPYGGINCSVINNTVICQ